MIWAWTKDALQAAKARVVKFGRHGAEHRSVLNKANAQERARSLAPLLADMKLRGLSSRAIAAELTTLGVATPAGGRWHPQTVRRALSRAQGITAGKQSACEGRCRKYSVVSNLAHCSPV